MSGLLQRLVPSRMRQWLRERALQGDTVRCPICERGAIAYLPSGSPPRPHVLCPFCGSRERARMAWLFLKEHGLLKPGSHILHVAPEPCMRTRLKALPMVRYIAGDRKEPGYTYPSDTLDLDVTAMPFPDDQFDLILCSHVLEHVPDDRQAMRELYRVLKPGGWAILMVPLDRACAVTQEDATVVDPEERKRLYGQFDHVRLYGRDYAERLKSAGFIVTEDAMTERMASEEVFRAGLLRSEMVHAVTKSTGHAVSA